MIHVHVDADDLWIYAVEYAGEAAAAASVYDDALPRFLELFADAGVKATFFVVGRDLERAAAREFVGEAVRRGHEIANHSHSHPIALHRLSATEKRREIDDAHDAIGRATGVDPVGFRAPGYYLDADIVAALERRGYLYDSSILPTYVLPLIKLYIRLTTGSAIDKQFGTPRAAFASQSPRLIGQSLYELPISVLPVLRLPVHSTFSFQLPTPARTALNRLVALRREPVVLFHAIDAVRSVDDDRLTRSVLPLRLSFDRRIDAIRAALAVASGRATWTTAERFAREGAPLPRSRVLTFGRAAGA